MRRASTRARGWSDSDRLVRLAAAEAIFWLDPTNRGRMVPTLRAMIVAADPARPVEVHRPLGLMLQVDRAGLPGPWCRPSAPGSATRMQRVRLPRHATGWWSWGPWRGTRSPRWRRCMNRSPARGAIPRGPRDHRHRPGRVRPRRGQSPGPARRCRHLPRRAHPGPRPLGHGDQPHAGPPAHPRRGPQDHPRGAGRSPGPIPSSASGSSSSWTIRRAPAAAAAANAARGIRIQ